MYMYRYSYSWRAHLAAHCNNLVWSMLSHIALHCPLCTCLLMLVAHHIRPDRTGPWSWLGIRSTTAWAWRLLSVGLSHVPTFAHEHMALRYTTLPLCWCTSVSVFMRLRFCVCVQRRQPVVGQVCAFIILVVVESYSLSIRIADDVVGSLWPHPVEVIWVSVIRWGARARLLFSCSVSSTSFP